MNTFVKLIMSEEPGPNFKLIPVSGRRRVGKTFTIKSAAAICHTNKRYVIYITASKNRTSFIARFGVAFKKVFGTLLPAPKTIDEACSCISWLLDNGLSVIIDEFQDLRAECIDFLEGLKFAFEKGQIIRGKVNSGVLILIGSNVTEFNACFDASSPLFMQGFYNYQFSPLNELQTVRFLKQFDHLTQLDRLFYALACNGRVGVLIDLWTLRLFPVRNVHQVKDLMKTLSLFQENSVKNELGDSLSAKLFDIFKSRNWASVEETLLEQLDPFDQHVFWDLLKYGYISKLSQIGRKKSKQRYLLNDSSILFTRVTTKKEVLQLEGFVLENVAAYYFAELGYCVISNSCWSERHGAEINLIATDDEAGLVVWGSCKLHADPLSIDKLAARFILYHLEREMDPAGLFSQSKSHKFVLFSPMPSPVKSINNWDKLIDMNTDQLYNYVSKHLKMPGLKPFPETLKLPSTPIQVEYLSFEDII